MITFSKNVACVAATSDDENSLKSSRQTCRRLQRSTDRNQNRSHSRESSTEMYSKFYVKNVCLSNRNPIADGKEVRQEDLALEKKREPTPCKSRKLIPGANSNKNEANHEKQMKILQKNIALNDLQQQLNEKNFQIDKLSKRLQIKQQSMAKLSKDLHQKEERIAKLVYVNKQMKARIQKLEESVLSGQQNLITTNNALEKLKKSIQENRVNDIKKENEMLKVKVNQLSSELQILLQELKLKSLRVVELDKENKTIRSKIDLETNLKNESMKEAYLQTEIKRLKELLEKSSSPLQRQMLEYFNKNQEQKIRLKNESKGLMIQLDYINRKYFEEVKLLTKSKTDQIIKYKNKCRALQNEFLRKEQQWQQRVRFQRQISNKNLLRVPRSNIKDFGDSSQSESHSIGQVRMSSVSFQLSSDND